MKLKGQKTLGIIYLVIGLVLLALSAFLHLDEEGLLAGFGGALSAVGLVRILRVARLSRNEEIAQEYEAQMHDERIAAIANRARAIVFFVMVYVMLAVALVAFYVFHETLLCQVLTYIVCGACILYAILFRVFSKKM